jgi:hypothetical protein
MFRLTRLAVTLTVSLSSAPLAGATMAGTAYRARMG